MTNLIRIIFPAPGSGNFDQLIDLFPGTPDRDARLRIHLNQDTIFQVSGIDIFQCPAEDPVSFGSQDNSSHRVTLSVH